MEKTAKKRVMTMWCSHYPSLSAKATRCEAVFPNYNKTRPKSQRVAPAESSLSAEISMSNGFVALPKFILQNPKLTPDSIVLYCQLLHFDRHGSKHGCIDRRETLSRFSNLSLGAKDSIPSCKQ